MTYSPPAPDTETSLARLLNTMERLKEAERQSRRDREDRKLERLSGGGARLWWIEDDETPNKPHEP